MDKRINELKTLAEEEGVPISASSEKALRTFAAAFSEPSAIFNLDNGNYRARWQSGLYSTTIEFRGDGNLSVMHLPRPNHDEAPAPAAWRWQCDGEWYLAKEKPEFAQSDIEVGKVRNIEPLAPYVRENDGPKSWIE